jgi:alcohol dehydrogenase
MPAIILTIDSLCEGLGLAPEVLRFAHSPGGKVVFGPGCLGQVGEEAKRLGGQRVLIVTDPGIASTGAVSQAAESLTAVGLIPFIYDKVRENPTTDDVDLGVLAAKEHQIDLIVGLGGGSSMDTAKGVNFLVSNGGIMRDYWGVGKATRPMLPFIAIPTTSGTGSECQSFALIADAVTHAKMACGDRAAAAAVALLDPTLTLTMPARVTAHTGIDAIAHALETAVCRKRTAISSAYSAAAWKLLVPGLTRVLDDPGDLEARARMQLGAAFAGTAIENSMLGLAHSCANPLTAHYGIVHGQAVGTMLPPVIRYNRQDPDAAAIYDALGGGRRVEETVRSLLLACQMDASLAAQGVAEEFLPTLAAEAATQWTAQFNPVSADPSHLETLYRAVL